MRSTIYQISNYPIGEDEYLNEDCISEGEFVTIDYVKPVTTKDERETHIKYLMCNLPKGMFSLNEDFSLTYHGNFEEWKKAYYKDVMEWANLMTPDNMLDYIGPAYQIMKTINNPLKTDRLFVTNAIDGIGTAEKSGDFFRTFVRKLKPGDIIYFGAILEYHP